MGYYIRIIAQKNPVVEMDEIISELNRKDLKLTIDIDTVDENKNWLISTIRNEKDEALLQIEKNEVKEGKLGKDEIEEFIEEIEDCKPDSAVKWLKNYFKDAKVVYAFQLLNSLYDDEKNFKILDVFKTTIWNKTGGIFQADGEGFSNEDGYHILWQFEDDVTGEWNMSVKGLLGWNNFVMELGDKTQRMEFLNGKVPKTAKKL